MNKVNKQTEIFFSSFINDLNNTPEIVSETLKEYGIDENKLAENASKLAGQLLAKMKLSIAKEQKASLLIKAKSLLSDVKENISNFNPSEKLYSMLQNNESNAAFTYNSLKEFSNDDILDMLSEIELLELVKVLEKQKD